MRESLRVLGFLILVTVLCSSCGSGSSEGFAGAGLDQFYDPLSGPTTEAAVGTSSQAAQTFTVGASGTIEFVEVFLSQSLLGASLTLDLRPANLGAPVELDALAVVTITIPDMAIGSVPGFYTFDLSSAAVPVTVGEEWAITLRAVGGTGIYLVSGDNPGGYPGGSAWTRVIPGTWSPVAGADFLFRTYVSP